MIDRMSGIGAVTRALALHRSGLSYSSISTIMRIYHGADRTAESWRAALRAAGAEPRVHAGRTFNNGRTS